MKVAVLGAGHGGQAMTADLTLAGHEVRLAAVPEHATNVRLLQSFGGIVVEGVTSSGKAVGFAKPALFTTDVAEAIKGAEVIMIVVPAFGQEAYTRQIIEHGGKGQLVVFNPGKFGTLAFVRMLKECGRLDDFLIGETSSLIYAAKTRGLGHVNIKAVKSELPFAAFPANKTAECIYILSNLFRQVVPAYGVLHTSIDAPDAMVHPVSTLLNMSRIEQMGPYRNSHYDITPSVARIIAAVDKERMAISERVCYETCSLIDTMRTMYKVKADNVYDGMYQISAHNVQMSPPDLQHRYVTEDIPYGLVALASIAKLVGIPTPAMDAIITIASVANGENYSETGRSAEKLGLQGMSLAEMVSYVMHGSSSST
jgi:opine dehydrogenase